MYIQKVEIKNIRSISHFEMTFQKPAGWHVLIGDNGAGKTTIIRSIAIALIGEKDAQALSAFEDFSNWLHPNGTKATVALSVERDNEFDKPIYNKKQPTAESIIHIERVNGNEKISVSGKVTPNNAVWGENSNSGWFVAAYGPFRRLRGSVDTFTYLTNSRPRLGACLTVFRDDVALTHLTPWLQFLALDAPKKPKAKLIIENIVNFINNAQLLPNGAILSDDIDSEGIKLNDANGVAVSLYDMSDGYRSVLSMTIDIIRFLIETYGTEKVFPNTKQEMIGLPGVVLIDEIDAHLHPTWQTSIGQWFTKYFPNIQFIVTTHSPLVCRACENGSIWRLAAQGSGRESEEITGIDKDKLVFGNILDAYGTEVFGQSPVRSDKTHEKAERLGHLNMRSAFGKITEAEEKERQNLQNILSTDVTVN